MSIVAGDEGVLGDLIAEGADGVAAGDEGGLEDEADIVRLGALLGGGIGVDDLGE